MVTNKKRNIINKQIIKHNKQIPKPILQNIYLNLEARFQYTYYYFSVLIFVTNNDLFRNLIDKKLKIKQKT